MKQCSLSTVACTVLMLMIRIVQFSTSFFDTYPLKIAGLIGTLIHSVMPITLHTDRV